MGTFPLTFPQMFTLDNPPPGNPLPSKFWKSQPMNCCHYILQCISDGGRWSNHSRIYHTVGETCDRTHWRYVIHLTSSPATTNHVRPINKHLPLSLRENPRVPMLTARTATSHPLGKSTCLTFELFYSSRIELALEQLVNRFALPWIRTFCQFLKRKAFLNHRTITNIFIALHASHATR